MKRVNNKEIENHPDPEVKDFAKDADKYHALDVLATSEGGKILIEGNIADVVSNVNVLSSRYSKLSHIEMIAICADIKSKLDTARTLTRSSKNKDGALEALAKALKE